MNEIESNRLDTNVDLNQKEITNDPVIISNPLPLVQDQIKLSIEVDEKKEYNTLNEPIYYTLRRDLIRIIIKMKHVLNPYLKDEDKPKLLLDWDLWGPLIFNMLLSAALAINNQDKTNLFVIEFIIFWVGSLVLYLNSDLLGGKMSLFQTFCILGYCMFPLVLISSLLAFIQMYEILRIILLIFGCVWASYSCIGFIKTSISDDKKIMMFYPIVLFYLFISWFILMNRPYDSHEDSS